MSNTLRWIFQHGIDLISTTGIIGGLLFTAVSYRSDIRSRRLSNLISLTQQHRDIWDNFIQNDELKRVLDPKADLESKPVSPQEAQFVVLLLLHLHCWFRAVQINEVKETEELFRDIRSFFSLPVPKRVWQERREFYDADFARFVDTGSGIL